MLFRNFARDTKKLKYFLCLLGTVGVLTMFFLRIPTINHEYVSLKNVISFERPQPVGQLYGVPSYLTDFERQTKTIWPNDTNCERFKVRFGKDLPLIFLASYPRSGNTWTRYLIESATGIFTGSIFKDRHLNNLGYQGEKEPFKGKTTIVVKTHGNAFNPSKKYFKNPETPVVLLIRNIEKSALSYWSYQIFHDFKKTAENSTYDTKGFKTHVNQVLDRWPKMNAEVLKTCKNLLVIFYEDLVHDPLKEIKKIVKFVGFEPDPERFNCLKKYTEGPVKRKHDEIDPFTAQQKRGFRKALLQIMTLLERRGYTPPREYFEYVHISPPNMTEKRS